jgi:peroxiredoxin
LQRCYQNPQFHWRLLRSSIALGLVFAITGCHAQSAKLGGPSEHGIAVVGQIAPLFDLPSIEGSSRMTSSDLRGRVTVLDFWAVWCDHCRESLKAGQTLLQRHPEVAVVGIAVDDDQAGMRRIAKELDVRFPMGWDASGATTIAYRISALPTTYVIDRALVIRYAHVGNVADVAIETEVSGLLAH